MSAELLTVLLGIAAAIGLALGVSVRARKLTPAGREVPPTDPDAAPARAEVAETLNSALDDVESAASSDTPEQDTVDILNRR